MIYNFLVILCIFSLPALYLIETITWMIRGLAKPTRAAWVISKTNIILYFSRFMYLTYVTIIYYLIETGLKRVDAYKILGLAFFIGSVSHIFLLKPKGINFVKWIAVKNLIEVGCTEFFRDSLNTKLVIYNIVAVMFISFGVIFPVILAYAFPDKRLTLSVSSQIMNAFGSYIILSKIDTVLSHAMDVGDLDLILKSHILGRMIGLAISAILILILTASYYIN